MSTNREDNVYIKAGETLKIEVFMKDLDGTPMNLLGASAKFGISTKEAITVKNCIISDSTVIAILTDEETSTLDGNYKYEIVLKTATGEKKSLAYGIIVVTQSLIGNIYGDNETLPVIPTPHGGYGRIPTTGWTNYVGEYLYRVQIPIAGIIESHIVYISIVEEDLITARVAEIAPTCDSYNGGVIFYAMRIPISPINFNFVVVGG